MELPSAIHIYTTGAILTEGRKAPYIDIYIHADDYNANGYLYNIKTHTCTAREYNICCARCLQIL